MSGISNLRKLKNASRIGILKKKRDTREKINIPTDSANQFIN